MSTTADPPLTPRGPVRLVLFDVSDTLCTMRKPVHVQYYEESISAGISPSSISPDSIRGAFRPAFKEMNQQFPLYGKHETPPLDSGEWWTRLIRRCIAHAGASPEEVEKAMPRLATRLLRRFESGEGYEVYDDSLPCLTVLREMGVKTGIVSNADPRILKTIGSLSILPLVRYPPTLSWDVELTKPNPGIFLAACQTAGESPGEGVLMVGDELLADYQGGMSAGLEGRLIRRHGGWSEGFSRGGSPEDLGGVHVIHHLDEIVEEVSRRNGVPRPIP